MLDCFFEFVSAGGVPRVFSVGTSVSRFTLGTAGRQLRWMTFITREKIIKKACNGIVVKEVS
jgi:hypothetical protein